MGCAAVSCVRSAVASSCEGAVATGTRLTADARWHMTGGAVSHVAAASDAAAADGSHVLPAAGQGADR